MKKQIFLSAAFCGLLVLSACGSKTEEPAAVPAPATPAPTVEITTPEPTDLVPGDSECRVVIDKQPGDEHLTEGGTALFTVKATGADSVRWIVNDPTLVHWYDMDDLKAKWPVIEIEGGDTETLRIKNVPAGLDGYRVSAIYTDKYGEVQTGLAQIYCAGFFTQIPSCYMFCSGAGAWRTVMKINEDGSFSGRFSDSDYDKVTECRFTGRFGNVRKIDGYSYSMELLSVDYPPEGETSTDMYGQTVVSAAPYGLDGGHEFIVFLPDASEDYLPDDFLIWAKPMSKMENGKFTGYGIFNKDEGNGFVDCTEADYNACK